MEPPPAAVPSTPPTQPVPAVGPDPADLWRKLEEQVWKTLAAQPGHITHVLLRGFDDALAVGSFSHWNDSGALERALSQVSDTAAESRAKPARVTLYRAVPD